MLLVYLTTGVRASEGLRLPRVGWERGEVLQKGGGEKLVTVPGHVQTVVRDYLAARVDSSRLLFVTHPGGAPMTPSGVRQVCLTVAGKLGIAPFTTHQLRHTFATQLLAQGIDIRVVAELMGHKNLQSIMIYTEVQEAARQEAMRAIENVVRPPEHVLPPDPRALTLQRLGKTKRPGRRGRPRFRIVP
jgi:integrase/recombinase XerC